MGGGTRWRPDTGKCHGMPHRAGTSRARANRGQVQFPRGARWPGAGPIRGDGTCPLNVCCGRILSWLHDPSVSLGTTHKSLRYSTVATTEVAIRRRVKLSLALLPGWRRRRCLYCGRRFRRCRLCCICCRLCCHFVCRQTFAMVVSVVVGSGGCGGLPLLLHLVLAVFEVVVMVVIALLLSLSL